MDRLAEIAGDTCNKFGCTLTEINGESDHAHMLIELIPAVHPVRLVNSLKTVSSRLLRKEYASHFNRYYSKPVLWSPSYCLITCGGAPLAIIQQYIQNQQEIQ